jgi:hypothetical protein
MTIAQRRAKTARKGGMGHVELFSQKGVANAKTPPREHSSIANNLHLKRGLV